MDRNLSRPRFFRLPLRKRLFSGKVTPSKFRSAGKAGIILLVGILASGIYLFYSYNHALGVAKTWSGGGTTNNWSEAANWTPSGAPATGDAVTFNSTSTKASTIDASFQGTVTSLTIASGYTNTITVNRSFTVSGSFSQAAGSFNGTSQTLSFFNFTLTAGTFTSTSGTLSVTAGMSISGSPTFNANGGTIAITGFNGAETLACGNVTFNLVTIVRTGTGNTLTIGSDCSLPLGANPNVQLAANGSTGSMILNGTLTGSGTFTVTAGNGTVTYSSGSSFTGFSGFVLPSGYNLTTAIAMNFSSFSPFSIASGSLTINTGGNLSLPATGTFNVSSFALSGGTFTSTSGNMNVAGNFTISSGTTFNANGGTITFNGNGSNQSLACNNATLNLVVITKTSSSQTTTVGSDCSLPLGANPTVQPGTSSGSSLTVNGTLSGSGTFTIAGAIGGTLTFGATSAFTGFSGLSLASGYSVVNNGITLNWSSFSPFSVSGSLSQTAGSSHWHQATTIL